MTLPTVGTRVSKEFHKLIVDAVKPLGFKTKSDLVEMALREFLSKRGYENRIPENNNKKLLKN